MKFRWSPAPSQPLLAGRLASRLGISPLLAQCLLNRGFSEPADIEGVLLPRLANLRDPFLLPDMDKAVERLLQARSEGERVVIFGDYDVDGVTATALLVELLRGLGWRVEWHLPERIGDGYGLSAGGVANCLKKLPGWGGGNGAARMKTLLLAVDCGSTATDVVASLQDRGIEVIILDHHQISKPPPAAVALVNPQLSRPGSNGNPAGGAEFTEFCSAGLAFKLAHAILKRGRATALPGAAEFDLKPMLDLVALGTIADLVPLTGENRILVSAGLGQLNRTARPGIVALKKIAGAPEAVGVYEVAFQLAPRLNAAGRLETAEDALRLLLAERLDAAMPLAQALDARNRERQSVEKAITDEVMVALRAKFDSQRHFVIVEGQAPWHIGVVGIVASRVVQEFYRPAIIIGGGAEEMRGSGRSIAGFDLAGALRECGHLLLRHGGHAMAAGLSILPHNIDPLREKLNELARRRLVADDLQPTLRLDARLGLDEIHFQMLGELERLKPHGQGNPAPQFWSGPLSHARPLQRIGAEKQHVKMRVNDGAASHEALWWKRGDGSLPVGKFDLAFTPQINRFNGSAIVQLKVLDWRPSAPGLTCRY
ncbi:MAG: single-stranded-DNA-specific exonuclease RecJ [Verrucomicrobia bacterium]|nr:single-stranded-DNA-specific exonuclease RecJ [Verrucomicrobiota bacterium]MDE3097942.1 single-stranded-DNA-specific exonuclease RecJ [Verrucomicrobiota bacterium]